MRIFRWLLAPAIGIVAFAVAAPAARSQASQIDSIVPASGRAGDRVTITGTGFGALNVVVAVNGIPAEVVTASGHDVVFVVPQGVATGRSTVTATNPGGRLGSIAFQVLGGMLLPGNPNALAKDAIFDVAPVAAPQTEIEAGVIMTRLGVRLAPDATVGGVNAALSGIGAGIASMSRGFLALTIAVPRQPTFQALHVLAATLESSPGIDFAHLAITSANDEIPSFSMTSTDHQLLPTGFPAAWNARRLVVDPETGSCRQPRVPILVGDKFVVPPPLVHDIGFSLLTFSFEIPFFSAPPNDNTDETHGWDVTLILGALFNPESKTGANPFSQCLQITPVQLGAMTGFEEVDRLVQNFPEGKFILNMSRSWGKVCGDAAPPPSEDVTIVPCEPRHFGSVIPDAIHRADDVLYWKQRTIARWDDFLMTTSAGNVRDEEPAGLYPVLGTAAFNSMFNASTLADPLLGWARDAGLWQPPSPGFDSLAATADEAFLLTNTIVALGLDQLGAADNVLKVGSTTRGATLTDLTESEFSNSGPDVVAVGEGVSTHELEPVNGTSFTAPQVAGLASYLWLLSPELRAAPARLTRQAIVDNAITTATAPRVVDAYAAVLSLDQASTPTTVSALIRLAILDVHADGRFDALDLADYRFALIDAGGGMVEPATADYSRYDLNGDGFTGGSQRRARFDLDRTGSTQFGAASYADVTAHIEGLEVQFSEAGLTDLEILCYYAYSELYQGGDPATRGALLNGLCGATITVEIDPSSVTLAAGASRQFAADVSGAADPRVNWSATGGTITDTGLFTAGTTAGTFTVRAISVIDLGAFADATVTVTAAAPPVITGSYDGTQTSGLVGNATDVDTRVVRWGLFPDNGLFTLIKFSGTFAFCGTGPFAQSGQCSPPFTITNGQFQATAPGKTVTGSLVAGRLRFVLNETCGTDENGHTVTCFTSFDGTILKVPVTPTSLDFGTVPVGGTSPSQFVTISNTGLLPVLVTVTTGGGFTLNGNTGNPCFPGDRPPFSGFFIQPGSACSVAVQFSPTIQGSSTVPLTVKVQDSLSQPVTVSLTGRTN